MSETTRAAGTAMAFDTAVGRCVIVWRADAVVRFRLPGHDPGTTVTPPTEIDWVHTVTGTRATTLTRVRAHIDGDLDDLRSIPLDLTGVPEFARTVYTVTRAIPPGNTLSYGDVAGRSGAAGAAQAVGQILGRNPIPLIIPCHRVLAADHTLHGFSAPGGTETKRRLLAIERTPGFGEPTLF